MNDPIQDGAVPINATAPSPAYNKNLMRQEFRARRAALTDEERRHASNRICERIWLLPELQRARTVHVYWPMLERGEVDLRPFIAGMLEREINVALPVVTPDADRHPDDPRMVSRRYTGEGCLTKNIWGVSEPLQNQSVPPSEIDLVIVPALGVSRTGYRIGYGKGHYDEFLAALEAPTVCAIYENCLVEHVPTEPHDVPVSIIVTENETLRTRKA